MSATQKLLRFGVFELNLDTEELRKSGTLIKLAPQPFRLLALLASHSGQVVSRDEIQRQLWGEETFVDFEHGMNKCIKQIRNVLGDDADKPLYIETIPRQGYRFIPPVVSKVIAAPQPQVVQSASGERVRVALLGTSPAGGHGSTAVAPSLPVAAPDRIVATPEPAVARDGEPRSRVPRIPLAWAAVVLALVALMGGGLYWRAHRRPVLTEKDTIVLADFDNKTGDSVFDDALRQGLWADLEQSPFLNILSDQRIAQTMALMTQPKGAGLTAALAREVCIRTESAATLEGAIAMLGSDYVVGLKAVNCHTGEEIAVEQFTVGSKEKILPRLGKAASQIRNKLGESLASVQKYDVRLEDVTTPSLEALQAYSLGRKTRFAEGDTAALPFYKRALELDPSFAIAHAGVATLYGNLNEVGLAVEDARMAYELRGKVSERERYSIEAIYYRRVTGELERTVASYQLWQESYPRDPVPYVNLSSLNQQLGSWKTAASQAREALRLEPSRSIVYVNLAGAYLGLNQFENAETVYKQAEVRKLSHELLLGGHYQVAFVTGDSALMEQLAADGAHKPGTQEVLLALQADTEAWYGKFKNAHELTKQAVVSALHKNAKETAATYGVLAALREVESGKRQEALADAHGAMTLGPNRDVQALAALVLSRVGDTSESQHLAAKMDRSFPLDTIVQKYWLPTIRAAVALQRNDPKKAIELLTVPSAIELGQPVQFNVALCPVYLRGQAYLMQHDGDAAVAEFRKFIEYRGVVLNFPWGALARLGLARAYAIQAQTDPAARDKARATYQDFLTLWKDADPDIPIYKQAKAEYATLK